jgi:hypothetical protein
MKADESAANESTPPGPEPAMAENGGPANPSGSIPELVLEPDPEIEALPAGGPANAEAQTPPRKPARPAPAKAGPAKAEPPVPSKPAPVAQVSEMTARIAMIDPEKRMDDVDALEAALNAAKKGELGRMLEATAAPETNAPAGNVEKAEEVPEITLDEALADQVQKSEELDQFAAEIAKANSLEEFSDKMAETLFGSEDLDAIAAEVVANPPQSDPDTMADAEPAAVTGAPDVKVDTPAPAPQPPPISTDGDLRESQAIRMDALNTLKEQSGAPAGENVELSSGPGVPAPKANGPRPDSIEDQITTSMTQNLEALDVSRMADSVGKDDEDEPKPRKSGGLFSRFRKSS